MATNASVARDPDKNNLLFYLGLNPRTARELAEKGWSYFMPEEKIGSKVESGTTSPGISTRV